MKGTRDLMVKGCRDCPFLQAEFHVCTHPDGPLLEFGQKVVTHEQWEKYERPADCPLSKLNTLVQLEEKPMPKSVAPQPKGRSCNRHDDCDAADEKARAAGRLSAEHCHDECCEECFGY